MSPSMFQSAQLTYSLLATKHNSPPSYNKFGHKMDEIPIHHDWTTNGQLQEFLSPKKKVKVFVGNRSQSTATYLGSKEVVVLGLILESNTPGFHQHFQKVGRFFIRKNSALILDNLSHPEFNESYNIPFFFWDKLSLKATIFVTITFSKLLS